MAQYVVLIDDNFHHMDESERIRHGEFNTAAEAIKACKAVVERSLEDVYEPGMTAGQLLSRYRMFGEDPFIISKSGDTRVLFSAWTYAEERSRSFVVERSASK